MYTTTWIILLHDTLTVFAVFTQHLLYTVHQLLYLCLHVQRALIPRRAQNCREAFETCDKYLITANMRSEKEKRVRYIFQKFAYIVFRCPYLPKFWSDFSINVTCWKLSTNAFYWFHFHQNPTDTLEDMGIGTRCMRSEKEKMVMSIFQKFRNIMFRWPYLPKFWSDFSVMQPVKSTRRMLSNGDIFIKTRPNFGRYVHRNIDINVTTRKRAKNAFEWWHFHQTTTNTLEDMTIGTFEAFEASYEYLSKTNKIIDYLSSINSSWQVFLIQ